MLFQRQKKINSLASKNIYSFSKPKKKLVFFILVILLILPISHVFAQPTPKPISEYTYPEPAPPGYEWRSIGGSEIPQYALVPINAPTNIVSGGYHLLKEFATDAFFAPIIAVLYVIAWFLTWFVGIAGGLLDLVLKPELYNFTGNEMIRYGWITVRDVCNLFFLLALLFIAICTILKIEKYHAKKTLLILIIMALLINFSRPIAVFIFDGSQLLMNEFLKQFPTGNNSASTVYAASSKIAESMYNNIPPWSGGNTSSPKLAVIYLFTIVFLFMLMVAYLTIAIFLVIRIVAVMILIIVSPFAFFAAIIPDFNKISSSWWNSMFKYSYYGPAAAFFLLLALRLQSSLSTLGQVNLAGDSEMSNIVSNLIHYATTIVFLYASIIMAQQFGIHFAGAVTGYANKVMKGAAKGFYQVPRWASRTTGVTGAVSQRAQQSKYGRLLTKSGREEAREEREAKVAEKIGVKGAKEKQVRKRAKKYKDENYSKEALKQMSDRGDEAAALRLAEDGNMDHATYASIMPKIKDPKLKDLLDDKIKEKTISVFIDYKAKTEAGARAASAGITLAAAESQIAEEEYRKMSADDWKKQKKKKDIFDPSYAYQAEAVNGFNLLHDDAKKDIGKNSSGVDLAAMRASGATIP